MDLHDMFFINKKLGFNPFSTHHSTGLLKDIEVVNIFRKSNSSFVHVLIVDLYSAISLVPIRECVSCQTKTINTKPLMNTPTRVKKEKS